MVDKNIESMIREFQMFANADDRDKLLLAYMNYSCQQLSCDQGTFLLQKDDKFVVEVEKKKNAEATLIPYSSDRQMRPDHIIRTVMTNYQDYTNNKLDQKSSLYFSHHKICSIFCLPIKIDSRHSGIVYYEHHSQSKIFNKKDVVIGKVMGLHIGMNLRNSILVSNLNQALYQLKISCAAEKMSRWNEVQAQRKKERLQTTKSQLEMSLDAARFTQKSLLMTDKAPQIKIESFYQSLKKVGGDWYGSFYDQNHQIVYVLIGDVTGHDLSSALVTGAVAGTTGTIVENFKKAKHSDLLDNISYLSKNLNTAVYYAGFHSQHSMTMFFVALDLNSGDLFHVNAGHPQPIRKPSHGGLLKLNSKGMPLGTSLDWVPKPTESKLDSGDILLLYTDGLFEYPCVNDLSRRGREMTSLIGNNSNFYQIDKNLRSFVTKRRGKERKDDLAYLLLEWHQAG